MQLIGELSENKFLRRIKNSGIHYSHGPFNISLKTDNAFFSHLFFNLYQHLALIPEDSIFHYQISLHNPSSFRKWIKPQLIFNIDNILPFEPYPSNHGLPLYEWGLNWCIGTTAHQYLMIHSASVEKHGKGLIFPAMPGSGKSTLCAALSYNGYRLLSDEFAIIRHDDGEILSAPRAIGLKNESINLIKSFLPAAWMGPSFEKTRKGTVAHLAPPRESLIKQHETATPSIIIFPRYRKGSKTRLTPISRSQAFTRLSNNSFNYQLSMETGFISLSRLIKSCDSYEFEYSDLHQAIEAIDSII
jgi:HprK-related kinase A